MDSLISQHKDRVKLIFQVSLQPELGLNIPTD